ncbi:hypothetical protein [Salipiger abyssi]|uniref:Uncharacterized protein n=1 Tax=Salipiger abyssi TaxID=1250539 RepID=A0A1P8UPF8_9RHOB|nr:hypothetical protein [Salipiger abyssi]APZ51247.1 hypothetical protein Ga0080574_TMP913 [Salipiger abyssi]
MPARMPSRTDDEMLLNMLDMRDFDGLSASKIGQRAGRSRAAVCGLFKRVRDDEARHEAECAARGVPVCQCLKPENRDGGMTRRWWRS